MDYEIVSRIHINKKRCRVIGEFLYDPWIDGIYFEGKYPFPVQLLVSEGLTKIQVTPMFLKLPFILRGWINIDILMREIDLMKLALKGKLLLHASCVDSTLIVGLPNSGKTYETYRLMSEGGSLISEEYTIIEPDVAHLYGFRAWPYKRTARSCLSAKTIKAGKIKLNWMEKQDLFANTIRAKLMPFMFEPVIWKDIIVSGRATSIKQIVYGSTGEPVMDYKHLIILTENEFPFMGEAFLEAYTLCSEFDMVVIQEHQRTLIKEFVESVYKK